MLKIKITSRHVKFEKKTIVSFIRWNYLKDISYLILEKPPTPSETTVSHEAVQESIMAVDETINNLIKELKQERKSHHKVCDYSTQKYWWC